jgi:hypothetical protein
MLENMVIVRLETLACIGVIEGAGTETCSQIMG